MNKWILASVLLFSSVSQAALSIETKDVLKVLLANSNKIKLTGDLAGQSLNEVLANYIAQSTVQSEGGNIVLNNVRSSCEFMEKSAIIECVVDLYSEAATVSNECMKKDEIGESSILLNVQLIKDRKKGLILKSNKVGSSLAG